MAIAFVLAGPAPVPRANPQLLMNGVPLMSSFYSPVVGLGKLEL